MQLDVNFWDSRYRTGQTGWDMGTVSPPLKGYIDQLEDKDLKILIPGAGNSYEAEYLFKKGFKNVTVVDISGYPLKNIADRVPDFPKEQLIEKDFFALEGKYELILEQAFFCTMDPPERPAYVDKMYELLPPGGKLAGLLFNFPLTPKGPPFGGSKEEYVALFEKKFEIKIMEEATNSIPPRQGNELFFLAQRPAS